MLANNQAPFIVIIILNWNNGHDTLKCVDACKKLSWQELHLLVVDNHSTDNSVETLRHNFPDLEIIETGTNLGFAGGNNIGIKRALELGAEYIWLLNNDAVPAPDALEPLVRSLLSTPAAACATSKIYYMDDPKRIWFAGGAWSKGHLRLRQHGAGQLDSGQFDRITETSSVTGCSMLLSCEYLHHIGMLEERYFLYWEDTDWSARTREKGYTLLFVPDSHVWHKVSASIAQRSAQQYYYYTRNGLYFCRKHDYSCMIKLLIYLVTDAAVGLIRGNPAMFQGFIRGCADFLRGRDGQQVFP
jgi:GT2 family glycosyltransferase